MNDVKDRKDYYLSLYRDIIEEVKNTGKRPSLFLHACCGPCLTYPLSQLIDNFNVTVGFFNPNIRPVEEYRKRLDTLRSFIERYAKDRGVEIPLVIDEEDFEEYDRLFKRRYDDFEGGKTCLSCHAYRMQRAYKYAHEKGFDFFTTVMTVSCKKPSKELNLIAEELERLYPETRYLYSDFKKEDGQLKGIRIAKQYDLYRQDYCGCLPSLMERNERKKNQSDKSSLILG